ncbi:MAG: 5-(carboxyamino)imidazole ribonucleotide synthase [Patescibacteria group bacterium]
MKTIGIAGGGQLGRMLAEAAQHLGFSVAILDPTEKCPAAEFADTHIVGSFKDKDKIHELARISDYITFEIESANAEALDELVASGKIVHPSPATLRTIKDKFGQKAFLRDNDIPVADFALIETEEDCRKQGDIFGYPFLLKARFDAYDGRGNCVIRSESDIADAFSALSKSPLYAERFVPFIKELSVVSARDTNGSIVSYPVVETIHKNNICHIVRSPAPVDSEIQKNAEALARKVLDVLGGVGVFACEMFLTAGGEILINEIAPRVHNSGHHTIEAFTASQFEQHIRAITGMPLVIPESLSQAAVMINILGERDAQAELFGNDQALALGGVTVHIYGKLQTRKERKMGHITVLSDSIEEAENKAIEARKLISI